MSAFEQLAKLVQFFMLKKRSKVMLKVTYDFY
jgi:hypothetical protein